jgi:hypothetical protein
MNTEIVTPQQARQLARRLFLKLYPDQEDWFDLAWDCYAKIGSQPGTKVTLANLPGLGAAAPVDPFTREAIESVLTLASNFLIKFPTTRTELLERLRLKVRKPNQPKSYAGWLDEFSDVLRELPPSSSTSLSEKEQEWIVALQGLGEHPTHLDSNRLRLPKNLCRILGPKLDEKWCVFLLRPTRMIAFPKCLWKHFWDSAKGNFGIDGAKIPDLQTTDCGTIMREFDKQKNGKYTYEYWAIPRNVIKGVNFSVEEDVQARSQLSVKCWIRPSTFWLEILPRRSAEPAGSSDLNL